MDLINDHFVGTKIRVACSISSHERDDFMKEQTKRYLQAKGKIKSFSPDGGLIINPCTIINEAFPADTRLTGINKIFKNDHFN